VLGGLGVIHKGLSPKDQASAVGRVKHYLSAFVVDPITVSPMDTVEQILKLRTEKNYKFFSFPVIDSEGKVIGLVTRSDFRFCRDTSKTIAQIMSTDIVTARAGLSLQKAYDLMMDRRKKILPILNGGGKLKGIFTLKDVERILSGSRTDYNVDVDGSLRVGAAIGVGDDARERMELLSQKKIDVVVIDTAHGNSRGVIEAIRFCKKNYPHIDVVAGNISEADGARRLARAGADGLRVGQGPGAICTTRIVAGIGRPQVTAVYNCARAVRGSKIPVCADGGIEFSGDMAIGLAVGGSSVMVGKMVAGTTESPGQVIFHDGRSFKIYRGMGSLGAMLDYKASRERYGQGGVTSDKLVPEGVEGEVEYKGDVSAIVFQLVGGVRSSLGYSGAKNIREFQQRAEVFWFSGAGMAESHPHGLLNMKKAPNYGR
jgi:IMP dehydrogenase